MTRVLHLFSNHKYTGPADPALILAGELSDRGVDLTFAAGRSLDGATGVEDLARKRGLRVDSRLTLSKHGKPLLTLRDVLRLKRWLAQEPFDIIHAHLQNDHLMAALAAPRSLPIVRTLYDAELPTGFRARTALKRTQYLFTFAGGLARDAQELYPAVQARAISPALDLDRFTTERSAEIRQTFRATSDDFVIGVVARMQTHRLFPELIEGFASLARTDAGLRLVVLGRGTHQARVAKEPAQRSGVGDQILFPGYIAPEKYPNYLPCFDAVIYLVPGSDGTCRAAREALASGVPVIASRRGLLPDLIDPDETGVLLREESPAAIAAAIQTLREDPARRNRLARHARETAVERFDSTRQAALVEATYHQLLEARSNEPVQ